MTQDEWGLWVDVEFDYPGLTSALIKTKEIRVSPKVFKHMQV